MSSYKKNSRYFLCMDTVMEIATEEAVRAVIREAATEETVREATREAATEADARAADAAA